MTVGSSDHPQQHGPTAVHHPRPHHHSIPREQTRDHEKDVLGLRLALGSILSPKRLSTPSSHASSGTASPCPAHFGPGLMHPYHHGPSHLHTPIESEGAPRQHEHHAAAVATIQETGEHHHGVRSVSGTPPKKTSPALSRANSSSHFPLHHHQDDHSPAPPILTTSNVHSLSPQQAQSVKQSQNAQNVRSSTHERQRVDPCHPYPHSHPHGDHDNNSNIPGHRGHFGAYIATLQSARAWDALVHGNMS